MRWWLYRIGTLVAVVFVGAAAAYPYHPCPTLSMHSMMSMPPSLAQTLATCGRWHVALRIQMALTGVLIALVIAFIGARIDQLILRHRRSRGAGLVPAP